VIVFAGAAGNTGTLPRPTLGAEVALGLQPGRWRFELSGAYWSPQSVTVTGGTAGAKFQAFSAEGRAAHSLPLGPFVVGPLAAVGIESIAASGFGGTVANFADSTVVGAFGAGGFASWRSPNGGGLRLEIEGRVPFSRPSFWVIEAAPTPNSLVFRMPPVDGQVVLGADASF
jgi:hypothetical protein